MTVRRSNLGCILALAAGVFLFVLASVPSSGGHGISASFLQSRADSQNVVIAIKGFQSEYSRLPTEAFPGPSELPQPFRGNIIRALVKNGDEKLNPRKIAFFEAKPAKKKSSGLLDENRVTTFVDPWGHPYFIIMDLNGDGKIPNPAKGKRVSRSSEIEPEELDLEVAAFSSGPDGNPDTWEDNIVSWR